MQMIDVDTRNSKAQLFRKDIKFSIGGQIQFVNRNEIFCFCLEQSSKQQEDEKIIMITSSSPIQQSKHV